MGQIGSFIFDHLKNDCIIRGITRKDLNIKDYNSLNNLINEFKPDEIYNLAGETNTKNAIANPIETFETTALAVVNLCEIIKNTNRKIKLFQALSSDMFKESQIITKNNINFTPKNPYSISKVSSYWTIKYYREKYNLPFYNGFIFNTDSNLRKGDYLFPKICKALKSENKILIIDNLFVQKDWLHASDVAKGIILCMNGKPDEYIFSSGKTHSIKELLIIAYSIINIDIEWINNIGIDKKTKKELIFSMNNIETEIVYGFDYDLEKMGWKREYNLEKIIKSIINGNS